MYTQFFEMDFLRPAAPLYLDGPGHEDNFPNLDLYMTNAIKWL